MAESAMGGKVKIKTGPQVEIAIGKWTLSDEILTANVTTSKSGGIEQSEPTVIKQSVTFEMPWDLAEHPDTLGFSKGSTVAVELELGTSGKSKTSSAVLITKIDYSADFTSDVIRLTVTGTANAAFVDD